MRFLIFANIICNLYHAKVFRAPSKKKQAGVNYGADIIRKEGRLPAEVVQQLVGT